jgi:RND family efflux transporter MFP subunit
MAVVLLTVLCLFPGCGREKAENSLPPPKGSGVPLPSVPNVGALMQVPTGSTASDPAALSATGTLYARNEAALGPSASGTLVDVAVREGDRVKKGQVLFRLDSGQANLSVQQAKALLESARVNLRAVELEHTRTKELHDRGSVPAATFEQVQARYDLAKSSVAQSQAQVALLQRSVADSVVRSPISGVVTQKLKNVGETVTMMPPTTVVIIQDTAVLELKARLPERALGLVGPGGKLKVRFPAVGLEREIVVSRVNPAVDVATRTVEIVAEIDNQDGALRPGMLAEVTLGGRAPVKGEGGGAGVAP